MSKQPLKTAQTGSPLEEEIDAFMESLPEMLRLQENKYVVFKNKSCLGFYETQAMAHDDCVKNLVAGPILIRQVKREYLEHGRYGRAKDIFSKSAKSG